MFNHTRPHTRTLWFTAGAFAVLLAAALALPSAARAVVNIEGQTPVPLSDYDSRASVAPTADQLAAASASGADVSWNRFGVASSVSKGGATPPTTRRGWPRGTRCRTTT